MPVSRYRLDFGAGFYLNRSVSADDWVTSLTGVEPTTARQNGAVVFATTRWSLVLAAQGESPGAHEALEKLCRTYWRPVYSFIRRQGATPEDAQDLTQGFFALLLERRDLDTVRREKGRLRSYLLTSVKHFLTNERYRAITIKRGEGRLLIPLDALRDCERRDGMPADTLTADQIFERRWAMAVLNQVLARLEEEYRVGGKKQLFDRLQKSFTNEPDSSSQVQIGRELGLTENAVNQAFHRFRQRYRELLREEVAHTVMVPVDIEDELRHLITVLRT
jgi:RNA polymerase sigma factor (sigma-70 family)